MGYKNNGIAKYSSIINKYIYNIMNQSHLIYIFISCIVIAMLLDIGIFIVIKKAEMKKVKNMAKEMRRSSMY